MAHRGDVIEQAANDIFKTSIYGYRQIDYEVKQNGRPLCNESLTGRNPTIFIFSHKLSRIQIMHLRYNSSYT